MSIGGAATATNKEMVEIVHCDRFLKLFYRGNVCRYFGIFVVKSSYFMISLAWILGGAMPPHL